MGWLAGRLMALKNRARSQLLLTRLAPRKGERVLEVGFGPGIDLVRLRTAVGPDGSVAGIDASGQMLRQARKRTADHDVDTRLGSAESLPWPDAFFDAVLSINSIAFWPDPEAGLAEIHRVLRPGGRVVIAMQPMWRGASAEDSERWRDRLRSAAEGLGFVQIDADTSAPLKPNPTAILAAAKASSSG